MFELSSNETHYKIVVINKTVYYQFVDFIFIIIM